MKLITIKKKKIFKLSGILIFIIVLGITTTSFAMQHYYKLDFSTGLVTASVLNVRSGPGTNYKVVATANKNEYIRVFAGIGDWYVVQVEGDYVGVVSQKYVKPIYASSSYTSGSSSNNSETAEIAQMTADEKEVFDLINQQRTKNGLATLKLDPEALNVARIKAQDMVDNNYFSHNSPIYGSPFNMLKNFKVSYNSAGENIAGNSSNSGAVNAWMNSEGHRANILNSSFNYTGIGVVNSQNYGKIYVQIFLGK